MCQHFRQETLEAAFTRGFNGNKVAETTNRVRSSTLAVSSLIFILLEKLVGINNAHYESVLFVVFRN